MCEQSKCHMISFYIYTCSEGPRSQHQCNVTKWQHVESTDQAWVIRNIQNPEHPQENHYDHYKKMESLWHHSKPAKRESLTNTHRLEKDGINLSNIQKAKAASKRS